MSKPFAPAVKCVDCDYVGEGKYPVRAVALHRRRMHTDTAGNALRRAKVHFGPLIEATGNYVNAIEAGDLLHIWPLGKKPSMETLRAWAEEWEDHKEQGILPNNLDGRIRAASQRLRAAREYGVWKMVQSYATAGTAVGQGIQSGKEYLHVEPKYLADGVSMLVREISAAFGTPKPTPTQIGNLIINAGERPAQLPKPVKDVIIDAEVRELTLEG